MTTQLKGQVTKVNAVGPYLTVGGKPVTRSSGTWAESRRPKAGVGCQVDGALGSPMPGSEVESEGEGNVSRVKGAPSRRLEISIYS